ncbi:MAG: AAA family ATPase [Acidobacteria bacterium]|nr:AAA family ATPase [Acidobacteriota bacterium]
MITALRRSLRSEFGMLMVTYSLAQGLDWDDSRISDERDRQTIQNALKSNNLLEVPQDQNEVARIIRGISHLSRMPMENLTWADGNPLRFAFCLEFAEHMIPALNNGTQTDNQLVAIELAHITGQSLALRKSGNLIIFHAREGLVDPLVCSTLHPIRLTQPNFSEKFAFISKATEIYPNARFDPNLTKEGVAYLTANTPNRSLESLIRASYRGGKLITTKELTHQKNRDVEEMSESTLLPLDTDRVADLRLFGRNVNKPRTILEELGNALLRRERTMPANILLAGAPATAKTDLALMVARIGNVPAYQMLSPKGGIVGETERKARLQQIALKEWSPNIAFIDEITEAFPLERNDFDGDSGASRAVMASLLTALSDESRRGESLLIATTNCPWRMGAAMRSRFIVIPVLQSLKEDYPGIITVTAARISPDFEATEDDENVIRAAEIFYTKGANPRHIRGCLSNIMMLAGTSVLSSELILQAAYDFCATTDLHSAIYADLWAIQSCTSKSFLPWSDSLDEYPIPQYLSDVIDPVNGEVNYRVLNEKIEQYRKHANL